MSESRVHVTQQSDVEALAVSAARTFPMTRPSEITDKGITVFVEKDLSPEWPRTYLDAPLRIALMHEIGEGLDGYLLIMAGGDFLLDPSFGVTCPSVAYLSKYYVRLNRHGGTVSKVLLDEVKRVTTVGLRIASTWFSANQDSVRTRWFYRKHGFVRVSARTMSAGDCVYDNYVYEHVFATS